MAFRGEKDQTELLEVFRSISAFGHPQSDANSSTQRSDQTEVALQANPRNTQPHNGRIIRMSLNHVS